MNPLLNMMSGGMNMGNNPMTIMQKFNQFRAQFPQNADPQQILNNMLQSGQINQSQIQQAKEMARQMGLLK